MEEASSDGVQILSLAPLDPLMKDFLVVRGTDNGIYWNSYSGSWGSWRSLGGATSSSPSLCHSGAGSAELIVRGTDNHIYHKSYSAGTWSSSWDSLGGAAKLQPVCVVVPSFYYGATLHPATLHVVVVGTDNALYYNHETLGEAPNWAGWQSLGGATPSKPTLVYTWPDDGRLDLLVRGMDNGIYHKSYYVVTNSWSTWDTPGGATLDTPAGAYYTANLVGVSTPSVCLDGFLGCRR